MLLLLPVEDHDLHGPSYTIPGIIEANDYDLLEEWHLPRPKPATTTSRGLGTDVERWRELVSQYFADPDTALCLMSYESGGNPNAKNPKSTARGLFQILASLWAPHFGVTYDDLYDPETSVRLAAQIYAMQGWSAWSPYGRGLCRR